jgi:excinuclease ABC subunit A
MFNGTYDDFLKSDTLTAQYILGKKKVSIEFEHTPSNNVVKIKKASKHNLQDVDVNIRLGTFTIIT